MTAGDPNTISTELVFKDGKQTVRRSLDGFVLLQVKDAVSLDQDIDNSYPVINGDPFGHVSGTVDRDKVRKGRYEVKDIEREYHVSGLEGHLRVIYSLFREWVVSPRNIYKWKKF